MGAGRTELARLIFGADRPDSGSISVAGKPATIASPADAVRLGIGYLSEDRKHLGLALGMDVRANIGLTAMARFSDRLGRIDEAALGQVAQDYIAQLAIRTPSDAQEVRLLSGGNQQKVVIAKWLATKPRVIILDEPTKGIDIGSKAMVHEFMAKLAAEGLAVIMVSSEIPEVLGMSDRVIVMREGRIVAELWDEAMTPESLVRAAAGIEEAA
jgi:ribose transport system ATP-binding protein